jgi:predicted RNA binding protein with dsRBD fold (UPF0201 family)
MSEKEYQQIMDLARKKLKKGYTREEAVFALYNAGIFDKEGNYTKPYKNLARLTTKK